MGTARALACSVRRPAEHIHQLTRPSAEIASEALNVSATIGHFTLSPGGEGRVRASVNSEIFRTFEILGSGVQCANFLGILSRVRSIRHSSLEIRHLIRFPRHVRQVRHGDWTTPLFRGKLLPTWARPEGSPTKGENGETGVRSQKPETQKPACGAETG
jgi:hypothetical protein